MKIGDKVWTNGTEITITTAPYTKFGGEWQDGIDNDGNVHTILTPSQQRANITKSQTAQDSQQAGFARLKALQKDT